VVNTGASWLAQVFSTAVGTCSFPGVHPHQSRPHVVLGHRESVLIPSNGAHFSYGPASGVVARMSNNITERRMSSDRPLGMRRHSQFSLGNV